MLLKLKARLSNAKSHPLPNTKDPGSDDEDKPDVPSLRNSVSAISATLRNPKRLIGQHEMVHAILLGIQATNHKLSSIANKTDDTDLTKLSTNEVQKHCKRILKIECPSCGSDNTKPHTFENFSFETYAPQVFESLRIHLNIQSTKHCSHYLSKLCGIYSNDDQQKQETLNDLNIEKHISFWKTLITNSKSGQLFFKTKDLLFIIKSMSKSECTFLRNNLNKYYQYMTHNEDSLICEFLGLYKVDIQYQKSVYVLIQKSVLYSFPQKLKMNKLYDLKGSTFGRLATRWKVELHEDDMEQINNSIRSGNVDAIADELKDIDYTKPADLEVESHFDEQFSPSFYVPEVAELHEATSMKSYKSKSAEDDDEKGHKRNESGAFFKRSKILKDVDFLKDKQCVFIGKKRRKMWLEQLEKDMRFLTELNVMDYSLLMGMHYRDNEEGNAYDEAIGSKKKRWIQGEMYTYDHGGMSYNESDDTLIDEEEEDELEQSWSDENMAKDMLKNCIYFAGIIDILQPYNARKKVENFVMGIKTDKTKVSCVEPAVYSKRLLEFMKNAVH